MLRHTGCFFSPVKSNMLIRKGYSCPRNCYRVSFEPLNWGILLFNVDNTVRHTTKTTKQLLHTLKNQQCCDICVIFDKVTDCHGHVYRQNGLNILPIVLATLVILRYMDVRNSNFVWRAGLNIGKG